MARANQRIASLRGRYAVHGTGLGSAGYGAAGLGLARRGGARGESHITSYRETGNADNRDKTGNNKALAAKRN